MSQRVRDVLLDSSAYFRFAQSIHPLLKELFGESPPYSLNVLAELDDEYNTSQRLQHKFEWVLQKEYREDRNAKRYKLNSKDSGEAVRAFGYLVSYTDSNSLNLSREDLLSLAVGLVKGIPVVTDDGGMRRVAETHNVDCWNSVKLLKVMLTSKRIDKDKVLELLEYWEYENDLPMPKDRLRKEYKEYFGENCPI